MLRQGFSALWWQARWARYAFLAGLLLGLLLGWFFHTVISLFLRLGVALIILVPLVVIAYLLWRRSTGRPSGLGGQRGSTQVVTWNADWNPMSRREAASDDELLEDARRRWEE